MSRPAPREHCLYLNAWLPHPSPPLSMSFIDRLYLDAWLPKQPPRKASSPPLFAIAKSSPPRTSRRASLPSRNPSHMPPTDTASRQSPTRHSRLTNPIAKPPSTNVPRILTPMNLLSRLNGAAEDFPEPLWLRRAPYPLATLSSFTFNAAAILMWPSVERAPMGGPASALVVSILLHAMGLLSLASWSTRSVL